MLYILALTGHHAKTLAQANKLSPQNYRYLVNPEQLKGQQDVEVLLGHKYDENPNFKEIYEALNTVGYMIIEDYAKWRKESKDVKHPWDT